jgi:hypothetical protein
VVAIDQHAARLADRRRPKRAPGRFSAEIEGSGDADRRVSGRALDTEKLGRMSRMSGR